MAGAPVRVVIADDDPGVRALLSHVVREASPRFEVVGLAAAADDAVTLAVDRGADVVLLDVSMPGGGGVGAAQALAVRRPQARIVAVSGHDDAQTVREMLRAGATRYLVKTAPIDEWITVLRGIVDAPAGRAPAAVPPVDVLIADGDPDRLVALADAVSAGHGLRLVGLAQTESHAVSLVGRHRPDVAVVGSALATRASLLMAEVGRASPDTRIVGVSAAGDPEEGLELLAAGATDVLSGDEAARRVVLAINAAVGRQRSDDRREEQRRFARLDRVLADEALAVALQPILDLAAEAPRGYEALARFPGEDGGPDVWFAEARRAGRGLELELLAVRRALERLEQVPEGRFLAINVSPDTAASGELAGLLAAAEPERVVLELTEHAPVDDYPGLRRALQGLRARGVRVAVDDCGAGFASLQHVAELEPDYLKLDGVLCRDLGRRVPAALARALVGFATEIGSTVVAEGIEAAADLAVLQTLGVELGQGYLLARPAMALKAV